MASGSRRKNVKKFFRGLFTWGEKGSMFDDTRRDASTSSFPTNDPPAAAMYTPSCSTLPTITTQDSNNLLPGQVNRSHMTTPGGIFNNANHFALYHPSFVDQSINHYHQQPADAARTIAQLLKHIHPGAAHDSSARNPPPRCHPGTRIAINERILNWFYDAEKKEWLLWIYGLAGVGKSAIVQTLAEKLALAKHLGASVFISRPRQCNDSQRIFLTIAYQLAQHINAYYTFITAKLARDPGLVNKGMKEQFQTFIVEPFVDKQIGAGGHTWAILVDGLDELDTRQGQQEIIRLITSFVLTHPRTPLTWAIASRPEPHISATFGQDKVVSSYTTEEIPIDSDEACQDVERYLNSSFEAIRNNFPLIVPGEDWPNQRDVWQVTHAASGLFAFAETAIRFVGDMDHANPVTRLKDVLSAIEHAKAGAFHDWPFAYLDSLYTRILESISPDLWPATKRVFSILLLDSESANRWAVYPTLPNISLVLCVDLGMIYASFNNCTSILKIPPREEESNSELAFYHASFGDYLLDPTRSGRFHISEEDAKEEVSSLLIRLWQGFQAQFPPGLDSVYRDRRDQFLREHAPEHIEKILETNPLFYIFDVFADVLVEKHPKQEGYFESDEDRDRCFDLLGQFDSSTACQALFDSTRVQFVDWVFDIWTEFGEELASRGIICAVPFEQLQLDYLDWPTLYPHYTYAKVDVVARNLEGGESRLRVRMQPALIFESTESDLQGTCSREEDILGLKEFQQRCPQLLVLLCGCPGKRFALLKDPKPSCGIEETLDSDSDCYDDASRYYVIPYPDPQNVPQFLKAKFVTIQETFSQIVTINWPPKADFRKLADATSDQYVFATMAIRFIEDRTHANPISRLKEILSIIDGQSDETSRLDVLYTHALRSTASTGWLIVKRALGALLYTQRSLSGVHCVSFLTICKILHLDKDMVYALFSHYSFVIVLPEQYRTNYETVAFYHSSFVDYLTDSTRSKDFHISVEGARKDVLWSMFRENGQDRNGLHMSFPAAYPSEVSRDIPDIFLDILIANHDPGQQGGPFISQEDCDQCLWVLGKLNMGIVKQFKARHFRTFFAWVFDIWEMFREELTERRIIRQVEFAQLRFNHLVQEDVPKFCTIARYSGSVQYCTECFEEISDLKDLESYRQRCPQLPVLICGSPGNRFALFEYRYTDADLIKWPRYKRPPASGLYIIPYSVQTPPEIY